MSKVPTLVFIPGAWHKPSCYDKIMQPLQHEYKIQCIPVDLPSMADNPNATFKDDVDAARDAILLGTQQGQDVIVIAHSYGGMVGNSAIKGLTRPQQSTESTHQHTRFGHVKALVLIASGFTITGLAFMDPFFGHPPPAWRVNKETGYAELIANPRKFFYHDLPVEEADYWASQLTTMSLKALFEGGEYAYAGWRDVPTWYVGTIEDVGLPVVVQRVQVGVVRAQGATVHHTELKSSHSPFLSMPDEVIAIILEVVKAVAGSRDGTREVVETTKSRHRVIPMVRLAAPGTWFKFGIPLFIGHALGWGIWGFIGLRRFWRGK